MRYVRGRREGSVSGIRVFWLEETDRERISLRRWSADGRGPCASNPSQDPRWSFHRATVVIGDELAAGLPSGDVHPHDDPRWPTQCACGYVFAQDDGWYLDRDSLYSRTDSAETTTLRDAPPGAMWDASWYRSRGHGDPWTGPDGLSLVVRLPNGHDWVVDQQCSNCTRDQFGPTPEHPNGRVWLGRTHYCWVRHGDPRTGVIHVDKNGNTCSAGGGSVIGGGWHGFLHNSHLVEC
ncbi:MAG: hypothetical protein ACREBE_04940 [bacterium]